MRHNMIGSFALSAFFDFFSLFSAHNEIKLLLESCLFRHVNSFSDDLFLDYSIKLIKDFQYIDGNLLKFLTKKSAIYFKYDKFWKTLVPEILNLTMKGLEKNEEKNYYLSFYRAINEIPNKIEDKDYEKVIIYNLIISNMIRYKKFWSCLMF